MKIALVSMNPKWEDKTLNRTLCREYLEIAAGQGADAVVFPEMTLTGFSMNTQAIAEDPDDSKTLRFFQSEAESKKLNIVFGMVLRGAQRATNNLILTARDGSTALNYAKIHPFTYSNENEFYAGGDQLGVADLDGVACGFSVCYDLRFPELYQALSKTCAAIFTIANWPAARADHWEALLKARAIENQAFMVGVNRTGRDGNGIDYVDSTFVFGPGGEKVAPEHSEGEIDFYSIDPQEVEALRKSFPVKQDRREKLYRSF